jgi:hypothetical protein
VTLADRILRAVSAWTRSAEERGVTRWCNVVENDHVRMTVTLHQDGRHVGLVRYWPVVPMTWEDGCFVATRSNLIYSGDAAREVKGQLEKALAAEALNSAAKR